VGGLNNTRMPHKYDNGQRNAAPTNSVRYVS